MNRNRKTKAMIVGPSGCAATATDPLGPGRRAKMQPVRPWAFERMGGPGALTLNAPAPEERKEADPDHICQAGDSSGTHT